MLFNERQLFYSTKTQRKYQCLSSVCNLKPVSYVKVVTLTFNHDDLVRTPDMDVCKFRREIFLTSSKITLSLEVVFSILLSATTNFNLYAIGTARAEALYGVKQNFAVKLQVKNPTSQDLHAVTKPISEYYTTKSPSTSECFSCNMRRCTVILLAYLCDDNPCFLQYLFGPLPTTMASFLQTYSMFLVCYSGWAFLYCSHSARRRHQTTDSFSLIDRWQFRKLAKEFFALIPTPAFYPDITGVYTTTTWVPLFLVFTVVQSQRNTSPTNLCWDVPSNLPLRVSISPRTIRSQCFKLWEQNLFYETSCSISGLLKKV